MDRSGAAESHEDEAPWIATALRGHRPQGSHSARITDLMNPLRRLYDTHTQRFCDGFGNGPFCGRRIDGDFAIRQFPRANVSQHYVGIGERGFSASTLITHRPGHGASAPGSNAETARRVQIGNAAAAGSNFTNVDAGSPDQLAPTADESIAHR